MNFNKYFFNAGFPTYPSTVNDFLPGGKKSNLEGLLQMKLLKSFKKVTSFSKRQYSFDTIDLLVFKKPQTPVCFFATMD